jgi:hypothetical protein
MFRKVAIALLAASVLAAPALAEIAAPAKAPRTTTGTAPANSANAGAPAVKTVKADKAPTKHRKVAGHHHHGTKVAMHKYVKHVKVAHHGNGGKIAGAGKTAVVKHTAAKPAVTRPATTNGAAVNTAPAQATTKPAAKPGVN